jgi:hypothetical protein
LDFFIFRIFYSMAYYKSNSLGLNIPKILEFSKKYFYSKCKLLSVINCTYNLNLDLFVDIKYFVDCISTNREDSNIEYFLILIVLSCFVNTDFKRIDELFKQFGFGFLEHMKRILECKPLDYEVYFIRDAFSQLMLNNMGFSQSVLFPDKDIRMIKSRLQVELFLDGKNFNLLPNILVKCSDIHFVFK